MIKSLFPEHNALHSASFYGAHTDDQDLIRLDQLSVHYRHHIALENISGAFKRGSLTAIVGPNGGGKSTLLKGILGMEALASGSVSLNKTFQGTISYLPQQADMDRSFPLTVQDVVASGHCQHQGFFKKFGKDLQEKVETALEEVGMLDCLNKSLDELSGGQFQRILFARLILQNAECILLDEPFTAIDSYTINDLIKIILKWHEAGKTLLIVNHDLDLVQDHFPTSLMIARRVLQWGKTEDVVTLESLRHAKYISRHLENNDRVLEDEIFEVNKL